MALVKKKPLKTLKEESKVIVVATMKGGAGKSMTSAGLASVIAHTYRHRILVIDADSNGSTTKHLGGNKDLNGTPHLLCRKLEGDFEIQEYDDYLAVIAGNTGFYEKDFVPNYKNLSKKVDQYTQNGYSILIDTSNKDFNITSNLIDLATDLVIVFDPDVDGFDLAKEVVDHIEATFDEDDAPVMHLVLNKYKAGKTQQMSELYYKNIQASWPEYHFYTVKEHPAFPKSRLVKCPLTKWNHKASLVVKDDDYVAKGPYITQLATIASNIYNG